MRLTTILAALTIGGLATGALAQEQVFIEPDEAVGVSARANVKAPRCAMVEDAHGKAIGTVIDLSEDLAVITIALRVEHRTDLLRVRGSRFEGVMRPISGDTVLWASSDCTGTPYIQAPVGEAIIVRRTSVAGPAQTLYAQVSASDPQNFPFGSFMNGNDLTCTALVGSDTAVQAKALVDLGPAFSAPFRIVDGKCD